MFNKIARFVIVFVSAAMLFISMTSVSMAQVEPPKTTNEEAQQCMVSAGKDCGQTILLPVTGGEITERNLQGGPTGRGGSVPFVSDEYLTDSSVTLLFLVLLFIVVLLAIVVILNRMSRATRRSRR